MTRYKDFKEYMENNHLDKIKKRLAPYIIQHRADFEKADVYEVKWIELSEAYVSGVTFKDLGGDWIEIRTSIDAEVEISARTKYGMDSYAETRMYNVFFKARLNNGLHNVSVTNVTDYDKNRYDRERSLSQSMIPYMYEEDVEKHAEEFLKKYCSKALLQPMPLPVEEIAKAMGMRIYFAPLASSVFGQTYFDEETVTVYKDLSGKETMEITTSPGTMLINPNVYFMYNIGTANNTIIHECVHWDRHRRPFELQKLLAGDCGYISCEIVESYDGMPEEGAGFKWMEWQANQLAPRILMPAEMTKRKLNDFIQASYEEAPQTRFAIHMENAINNLSLFFQVSNLAAKLRAIELGYDQAQGVQVYCNNKKLPSFSFAKGSLKKDQTFVIDESNLLICLMLNPTLGKLYSEGKIVYANCMLCLNTKKYIEFDSEGNIELTNYALDHIDECCFIFNRKYSASSVYSDTFYRRCFLCRDIDAGAFMEAEYDPENKSNQSKEKREKELAKITDTAASIADIMAGLPGGFSNTLRAHMQRKNINEEELAYRSNISTVTLSKYLNQNDAVKKYENVLAVCKALYIHPACMEDLIEKAGFSDTNDRTRLVVKYLIWHHADDTVEEWQQKLDEAHINLQLPKRK